MLVGIASCVPAGLVVTVIAAVSGSTSILPRTRMQSHEGLKLFVCARSNGPALAGTSKTSPNGTHPLEPAVAQAPVPL